MTFPRRSARLAAKGAAPTLHIEELALSASEKHDCVIIIRQYLNDVDTARGRTAKAVIVTCMARYLLENTRFVIAHRRFYETLIHKMEEMKAETPLEDAVIDMQFRNAVNNVLAAFK